jgi:hypothetical protein
MIVAGLIGGLDGSLKVEDVECLTENDVILVVEEVDAEFANGSALVFQGSSLCFEFGRLITHQDPDVLIGNSSDIRNRRRARSRSCCATVKSGVLGISASLSITSGSTGVSLCRQRLENSVLLAIRTRCALFCQYAKTFGPSLPKAASYRPVERTNRSGTRRRSSAKARRPASIRQRIVSIDIAKRNGMAESSSTEFHIWQNLGSRIIAGYGYRVDALRVALLQSFRPDADNAEQIASCCDLHRASGAG